MRVFRPSTASIQTSPPLPPSPPAGRPYSMYVSRRNATAPRPPLPERMKILHSSRNFIGGETSWGLTRPGKAGLGQHDDEGGRRRLGDGPEEEGLHAHGEGAGRPDAGRQPRPAERQDQGGAPREESEQRPALGPGRDPGRRRPHPPERQQEPRSRSG